MTTNATYDWSRDRPGYCFLKAASEAGVSSITAFVNSMPSALTASKQPCGNVLDAGQVDRLERYITEVLSDFAENGIDVEYISPMNEPDNDFESCSQEEMSVQSSLRAQVFQNLRSALQASKSEVVRRVKIMGDETSQIATQALKEYGK